VGPYAYHQELGLDSASLAHVGRVGVDWLVAEGRHGLVVSMVPRSACCPA